MNSGYSKCHTNLLQLCEHMRACICACVCVCACMCVLYSSQNKGKELVGHLFKIEDSPLEMFC